MKPTRSGVMKNFNISCLDDFFINDAMAIDNVLTVADRQMMIKYAVDGIKATEFEKCIPGYEHILLYHGQSLINACAEEGLIVNIFSLRDSVEFISVQTISKSNIDIEKYVPVLGVSQKAEAMVFKVVSLATTESNSRLFWREYWHLFCFCW